jgi:hypothetical protein
MADSSDNTLTCSDCHQKVNADDQFCPHCGSLFEKNLRCIHHPHEEAAGACIICRLPYGSKCGGRVGKIFLCRKHEAYEIYEGMARVFGVSDDVTAQYACKCLEQEGLHPILYSRKASPLSLGGADYTLFRASGEYDGHIINEIKVMVPCQEVVEAERVLKKLDLKA